MLTESWDKGFCSIDTGREYGGKVGLLAKVMFGISKIFLDIPSAKVMKR